MKFFMFYVSIIFQKNLQLVVIWGGGGSPKYFLDIFGGGGIQKENGNFQIFTHPSPSHK